MSPTLNGKATPFLLLPRHRDNPTFLSPLAFAHDEMALILKYTYDRI